MSSGEERHGAVAVLAAAPTLMVSVERGQGGRVDDIHLHPGDQLRAALEGGADVVKVAPPGRCWCRGPRSRCWPTSARGGWSRWARPPSGRSTTAARATR